MVLKDIPRRRTDRLRGCSIDRFMGWFEYLGDAALGITLVVRGEIQLAAAFTRRDPSYS